MRCQKCGAPTHIIRTKKEEESPLERRSRERRCQVCQNIQSTIEVDRSEVNTKKVEENNKKKN
tara:strand:+ start:18015 stop:18203 length:189 start_codon:yes stop_codon:yes gene_type:complete